MNTSLADLNVGICFRKFDMPYSYFYYPATSSHTQCSLPGLVYGQTYFIFITQSLCNLQYYISILHSKSIYVYNTDKIVVFFLSQHDLHTNQYAKNQTGWLIPLYKRGPGHVILFYTSSSPFCINLSRVNHKATSLISPQIGIILLQNISSVPAYGVYTIFQSVWIQPVFP